MSEKRYDDDKLFRFVWRIKNADGSPETSEGYGRDAADAATRLGYGGGAMRALDYWQQVDEATS
jgi:hypothetical protein